MFKFDDPKNSVLIYANNAFSNESRAKFPLRGKVADGYIRYAKTQIKGVIDESGDDLNVSAVLGIREDIPIYKSISDFQASGNHADVFLIGVAPSGGEISDDLFSTIKIAIEAGMNIMSGMHYELNKNDELVSLARNKDVEMWDVRIPPQDIPVASCKAYFVKRPIILTCAADAAIGKMTVGFEIENELSKRGIKGELLATGQTAIMIKGRGISVDRVIGDFMPGAVEKLVIEADDANRFLIIEGQGGLSHPGYAPVTLALIHGGMPTHAILIVRPIRKHSIGSKLIKLPSIEETMELYRMSALPLRRPDFIGIAVNTVGMGDEEAREYIDKTRIETGLPVEDVIRFPTNALADAVERVVTLSENGL